MLKLEAKAFAEAVAKKITNVVAKSVAQRFEKRFSKNKWKTNITKRRINSAFSKIFKDNPSVAPPPHDTVCQFIEIIADR